MFLSHSRDISPDFEYNYQDAKIIKKISKCKCEDDAIRLFDEYKGKLTDYSYWFMLGSLWVDCVNCASVSFWRSLFSSGRKNMHTSIMKPSELRFLKRIPNEVTVYRAKRKGEDDCLSYTLDQKVAGGMARSRAVDIIHEYRVKKEDIAAIFLRCGKSEVLILDSRKTEFICVNAV